MPCWRAKHGSHDRDATVGFRPRQLHAYAAEFLIEQALQLVPTVADNEGGMLVESGKHSLHRRIE